jgi:predicted phosphodiesterase
VRTAILSDIHGNLSALEAVIADLRDASPDLVLLGGDLATHGHRPAQVIDWLRETGWQGVVGNTDEMLWMPGLRERLTQNAPKLAPLFDALFGQLAPATCDLLGAERIAWLRQLPRAVSVEGLLLVHATPGDLWKAPMPDAAEEELAAAYRSAAARRVVYGHIHRPYVRELATGTVVANCGSVGLPFDGDTRASYLLLDEGCIDVRRVSYDVEREAKDLLRSGYPLAGWLAHILRTASYTPLPPR